MYLSAQRLSFCPYALYRELIVAMDRAFTFRLLCFVKQKRTSNSSMQLCNIYTSMQPDRFVPPGLLSGSATSAVINGAGPDGCLPELDMFPPVAKLCVYGICAFVLRCFFLFSHCTPQWSIVWGLNYYYFFLPFLM